MTMTSIELQVPTEAKTYVLDKTTEEVQTVKRIEGIVMIVVSDAIPIIALLRGTA